MVPPPRSQWYHSPVSPTQLPLTSSSHAGRIPVLVDNTQSPPFPVMETSAELFYLLKFYDKKDVFGFTNDLERNEALQWTFFWHGSGSPYQGQVNHFILAAPEKIEYAINRFKNETLRVFGVLEI